MFCTDIPAPQYLIFFTSVPNLLYYSHIPTALLAVLFGFFIFFKDQKSLISKVLLFVSLAFFTWSFFDLILWTTNSSSRMMFYWSIINIFEVLVSAGTLYFTYLFVKKNDAPMKYKLTIGAFLLPLIILTPTSLNNYGINLIDCGTKQGKLIYYFYFLEIFLIVWLISFLIKSIRGYFGERKKEIAFFSIGAICFILSFSGANVVSSILYLIYPNNDNFWKILQYGLFGMPIFMGFLAYLIVKYHVFRIKLIAAQALVISLIILIGSEFFFANSLTNQILIGITLAISTVFGIMLVRSIKLEVQRKEELQVMSDKLAGANDQLRKLDNAKSEFISIASHQLRTPLTAIKGFISLLLEGSYGKLVPQQEDVLNKVYTSNERLVNLVEDLLNISRMESGRMEFKFDRWKIEDICQEVVDTFVLRAKEHNLYLEYKKPEQPLPEVMIDGTKVREVISNMVDNAIKYCPKGGVKIKAEQVEDNIRVTVSDTGIGIPKTELPYLFAKFSRGKDITRLNSAGTGLGLYVGKQMIENNGGKIWAESDGQGLGSRFIIEIPIQQDEELLKKWS